MFESDFAQTIALTLKLSAVTTCRLFFIAVPIAYFIAFAKFRLKPIVEAIVSMPLVLPPSVLGFYMLIFFSPMNSLGAWLEKNFDL